MHNERLNHLGMIAQSNSSNVIFQEENYIQNVSEIQYSSYKER